jgi:chromosome segregation ATPase
MEKQFKVGDRVRVAAHAYASLGYHRGKLATVQEHRPAPNPGFVDVWMVLVDGTLGLLAATAIEIEPETVTDWKPIAYQHERQRDEAMGQRDRFRRERDTARQQVIDTDNELLKVREQYAELTAAHVALGMERTQYQRERDEQRERAEDWKRTCGEAQARLAEVSRERNEATHQRDAAVRQRDEARELLEVAKAQVTELAQIDVARAGRMRDVESQRDELRRQVSDLRSALDDTGRPATALAARVARLEAIHMAREVARADFRTRMRP